MPASSEVFVAPPVLVLVVAVVTFILVVVDKVITVPSGPSTAPVSLEFGPPPRKRPVVPSARDYFTTTNWRKTMYHYK